MATSIQPVQPAESSSDGTQPAHVVWVDEGFDAFVRDRSAGLARTAFLLTANRHAAEVMLHTAISWRRRRWHGELPTAAVPEVASRDDGIAGVDERLRGALAQVPPRQRAALVLRYYDDLTEAETAAVLGCSVGTVKSQTAKGLARLRTLLGTEHDG